MKSALRRTITALPVLLICLLAGCSTPDKTLAPAAPYQVVDMSGDWEKNYQLSDDFQTEFNLYLSDVRRRFNSLPDSGRNSAISVGTAGGSTESVIGLARFTEEITRMPVLHIQQDRSRVRIERENDFTLLCEFFDQQFATSKNAFGTEQCGWNGNQLLYRFNLDDGLSIYYQVTLAPNGRELNITTTVTSSEVATPMTISNYYRRYTPPEDDIDCVLTLTRNNVCRRAGTQ